VIEGDAVSREAARQRGSADRARRRRGLLATFSKAGLIDTYRFLIIPIALGGQGDVRGADSLCT
jgi:hypothetical protein